MTTMKKSAAALAATSLMMLGLGAATPAQAAPAAKRYQNCTALNMDYPHGVGKPGARDKTTGKYRVTTFKVDKALYAKNPHLDRDKDGIACEKR